MWRSLRRSKTLREDGPLVYCSYNGRNIAPHNAWGASDFWLGVEMAAQMKLTQLEPTAMPCIEAIEQDILDTWLEAYIEAGTA